MSGAGMHAIVADSVFDGSTVRRQHAVVIDGSKIAAVLPARNLPAAMTRKTLPRDAWLAPGFIDAQVNGGGDVLFNDDPTREGIAAIAAAHRTFGTTGLMPTLITDTPEKMRAAASAFDKASQMNPGVLGIHFEGPFLSPEKPGVHDGGLIRMATPEDEEFLTEPRNGVTLVTLAPERAPAGFISRLARSGVRVSLGHSMATYAETQAAMAEGLTGFTHLFNAMRPLASREPGPIAAALETSGVWFSIIADGLHVDPAMLRLSLRGAASPMLVTDAMPPVGGERPVFMLQGREVRVHGGRCTRTDGTLAGAALDMATAVRNCVRLLDTPIEDALRFASTEPARFLGLGHKLGRLAPGYRADMVALNPKEGGILETWVAGET